MPDITLCKGGDCGIKENCERYKAEPNTFRQSYFINPPFTPKMDGTSCQYFEYYRGKFNEKKD